ncbi:MAG TPA: diguanylate cyclase [Xanthomonadaceae bacterium]|nr:diguanylate cyclase [Xanthomonadaceae bacterium]
MILPLLLALAATAVFAQDAPALRQFSVVDSGLRVDQLLEGRYDAQFLPVAGARANLRAGGEYTHWLRLDVDRTDAPQVLVLEPVPADRINVFAAGPGGRYAETGLRMFRPGAMDWPLTRHAVPLDASSGQPVYLSVVTRVPVGVAPRIQDAEAFAGSDRRLAAAIAAAQVLMLAVALFLVVLSVAVRDGVYARFAALGFAWLLLAMAAGGQLYALPGLAIIGWWGVLGLVALELGVAALTLWSIEGALALSGRDGRILRLLAIALAAIAGFALLNLQTLAVPLRVIALTALVAGQLMALGLSLRAALGGQTLGRALAPAFALALLLAASTSFTTLARVGGLDPGPAALTVGAAVVCLLFALALLDRVADLRRERDRAQATAQRVDTTLQVEASRRELVEGLQQVMRSAPAGDLEWMAFRKLLAALRTPIPHRAAAIVAYGYHDLDLLVSEPGEDKPRFVALLEQRGSNIKGICRGRTPLQIRLDPQFEDANAGPEEEPPRESLVGVYAVIPLGIAKPGWGALLIERASEDFQTAEMRMAFELAQITLAASDQAASQVELTRRAEIDPLTGAFNRRAAEVAMDEAFARALDGRLPVSVLVLDIDRFRALNDKHGHEIGDRSLAAAAECIRKLLQPGDLLARMGADEFAVMLPGRALDAGREAAERIVAAIAQLRVRDESAIVSFTASAGVGSRGGDEESPKHMLGRATRAMETARSNGGNRVQGQGPRFGSAGEEPPDPLVL